MASVEMPAQAALAAVRNEREWLKSQAWLEFQARVLDLMNSRGHDYIMSASCPEPLFDKIIGFYVVPVVMGPCGYTTRHGSFHEFKAVGHPA